MQICFTHDFIRSRLVSDDGDANARWLHAILSPALLHLGHDVHRFGAFGSGAGFIRAPDRGRPGGDGAAAWSASFSNPEWEPRVAEACADLRTFDLVVGFELSPNQTRFLDAGGTPFLDVGIDPIRFAPDLFLRVRSSDAGFERTLAAHEITAEELVPHVALLRSNVARALPADAGERPATLFIGQTDVDTSLVHHGALARVEPLVDRIRALVHGGPLLLKPHPHGGLHQDIRTLHDAFPDARIVNDNVYALLCSPLVRQVVTLSSGVAQEARLLGKPATCLITPDQVSRRGYRIGLEALHPAFWQTLDGGRAPTRMARPPLAGELRRTLQESWGFAAVPRMEDRRVSPGRSASFCATGDGRRLLTSGWSAPEPAGTWSVGERATLLVDAGDEAVDLTLTCQAFVPRGLGARTVEISTRPGRGTRRITFRSQRVRRIELRLPASAEPVEIVIRIPGPISPSSLGGSEDARRLGLRLIQAEIRPRQRRATVALQPGVAVRLFQLVSGLAYGWLKWAT